MNTTSAALGDQPRTLIPRAIPICRRSQNDLAWALAAQGNYDLAADSISSKSVEICQDPIRRKAIPGAIPNWPRPWPTWAPWSCARENSRAGVALLNQAPEMCNNLDELFVAAAVRGRGHWATCLDKGHI